MLIPKFKHKVTGKLCGVGKIWRHHCVEDTIPLQSVLKFGNLLINIILFLASLEISMTVKFYIFGDFNIKSRENCLIYGKSEGYIVFRISIRSRICEKFERILKKKYFFCLASVIYVSNKILKVFLGRSMTGRQKILFPTKSKVRNMLVVFFRNISR